MTVGIPGTGIGGLFYLALAFLMPLRELVEVARGRSTVARWRFIASQLLLIGAMLGLMTAQAVLLKKAAGLVVSAFPSAHVSHDLQTVVSSSTGLATAGTWISVGMLVTILLLVQVARLIVRAGERYARFRDDRRLRATLAA